MVIGCHACTIAAGQSLSLFPAEEPEIRLLPSFHIRSEPASAEIPHLGSSVAIHRSSDGSVVARRIVTDAADKLYFAYELDIGPGGQPDAFLASFRPPDPVGIGLDPSQLAMRTPTAFPPRRAVHLGESMAISLGVVPGSGATLIDEVIVEGTPLIVEAGALYLRDKSVLGLARLHLNRELRKRGIQPPPRPNQPSSPPPAPTIASAPRQFAAADVEFKATLFLRLRVNGGPEIDLPSARGRLIWFSLPARGRYILTLVPRPELGFVKAGEARGGYVNLQMDGDPFVLTSGAPIAPGGAPYFVYALHDREWAPASSSQRGKPQAGSVGLEEIVALRKEPVK
jgi:hypothetical protein